MERAQSNLSPTEYAAAVDRNPNFGLLVPAGTSGSAIGSSSPSSSGTSSDTSNSAAETNARQQLEQIAREPGNSALKMRLAQDGVSLTDNSDVGPGQRFESFVDKLGYVMEAKAALVLAMHMSMVASGGAPSNDEDVGKAREALRGAA